MLKTVLATCSAVVISATSALAVDMSAAEFEAYTTGKTLYYGAEGREYGVEEYMENRRVRWSFLDGRCREGEWYEDANGLICFVYEDRPDPQCWSFERGSGGGLVARFQNDPEGTLLYEANRNDEPMLCLGPEIGV
ncbi:hypothetical protein [Phaeobacter sp. J2-8]|uniref:hypothetical protein n=1 Tax=Phaeobacter sp. J2-8 TaxID=2931394 RepID=UPI001FD273AB|nr:hypothetical protein [Phaeobacter sp. J2-8]MCJ7874911.1 hypothetical protein [Phaeobacter sp. J2-8]